jgi:ribonuclease J
MSSRVIPGNEHEVMRVMTDLLRRGVELRTWWSDRAVHVSGHAHRDDQRRMISIVRPRAFVPVHGTLHHLTRHAALARELGVADVCVLENGDVAELDEHALRKVGRAPVGRVYVFGGRELPAKVIDDRAALAARGAAYASVPVDARGDLAGDIAVASRGVLDDRLDAAVLAAASDEARAAIGALTERSDDAIGEAVRQAVRRALGRVLGFKPVTLVTVLRVRA